MTEQKLPQQEAAEAERPTVVFEVKPEEKKEDDAHLYDPRRGG